MSRYTLIGGAAAAVLASVPFAGAGAQVDGADANRAAITVLAPRVATEQDTDLVGQTRTLTASSIVYIDDLDLRSQAGRDELKDRVKLAAQETCEWLNEIYPLDGTQSAESDCVETAVAQTQPQIDQALAQYGG